MNADELREFIEIAESKGIEYREYAGEYCGRGTYGRSTLALVFDDLMDVYEIEKTMRDRNEGADEIDSAKSRKFRIDSLGRYRVIVY